MAVHENVKILSGRVRIIAGVAQAIVDRFVVRDPAAGHVDEWITHVPAAAGATSQGILAMKPDTVRSDYTGTVACGYVIPDGAEAVIELGEAVTVLGAALRVGGNGAEVDGAAYLADASGDFIVGYAAELGVVGQKIRFNYLNGGKLP